MGSGEERGGPDPDATAWSDERGFCQLRANGDYALDMDLGVSGRLRQCCVARTAPVRAEAANLSDMLVRAKYRSTHDLP